jgi:glycosyltransferase involved in cell wall biosynthesis
LIVSDDAAAWNAADSLRERNPFIGVLHADDAWYYDLAARHNQAVHRLVAVSTRVARRAHQIVNGADISVIPCGVPVSPEPTPSPRARKPSDAIRLIWIGRIDERQKRVSDLPSIAVALGAAGFRFQLDIVGDGDDVEVIRSGFPSSLAPSLRFHGWVSRSAVSGLLSASDVLLLPSNFEGVPVAAMEALAHGCAVVASSASGLEEYATPSHSAECLWIHEVGDVQAAAQGVMSAMATDPHRRHAAARRLAEVEFSIAVCMDRYSHLLGELSVPEPSRDVRQVQTLHTSLVSWGLAAARGVRRRIANSSLMRSPPARSDGL